MNNKNIDIRLLDNWLKRCEANILWDVIIPATGRKLTCYYLPPLNREVIIKRGAGEMPESGWEMYTNVASRSAATDFPVEALWKT